MAPKEPNHGEYDAKLQEADLSRHSAANHHHSHHHSHQTTGGAGVTPRSMGQTRDPPLKSLFDSVYLRQPMTPLNWVLLILYAPFGTLLAIARILLTAIVCFSATYSERYLPWTLSDRTLFHLICIISGVYIRKVVGKKPTEKELAHSFIVSNHTMTGDPGVLYFLYPHNAKVVQKAGVGSFDIITRHKIKVGGDRNQVKEQILHSIEKDPTPVVIFPEGATTNGLVGLLRFSAFIFSLDRPVHPVGLRYNPALSFIPFHSVKPYYSFHMFLVAFQPWVAVDAHVLPAQSRSETETPEDFAERTQKLIAGAIGLAATAHTAGDKGSLRASAKKLE